MDAADESLFMKHFALIHDPRINRTKRHQLVDILAIAVMASLCGVDDCHGFQVFAEARFDWLKKFLALPGGVPSHDTFSRVLSRIDPQAFEEAFAAWVADTVELLPGEVVAIDGKTLRRSFDRKRGAGPIHIVSAWASEAGLALGHVKVDEKSNEITAIPDLLKLLELRDCIVTTDAMGCQREIAEKIVEEQAGYCLALKDNQKTVADDARRRFEETSECEWHETKERNRGREERRRYRVLPLSEEFEIDYDWPYAASIGHVKSTRIVDGNASYDERFYIMSFDADVMKFARCVRSHWGVENGLHHVLDVTFADDSSRTRTGSGPENLATVKRIALNLLKRSDMKYSMPKKRLMCAHNNDALLKTLLS